MCVHEVQRMEREWTTAPQQKTCTRRWPSQSCWPLNLPLRISPIKVICLLVQSDRRYWSPSYWHEPTRFVGVSPSRVQKVFTTKNQWYVTRQRTLLGEGLSWICHRHMLFVAFHQLHRLWKCASCTITTPMQWFWEQLKGLTRINCKTKQIMALQNVQSREGIWIMNSLPGGSRWCSRNSKQALLLTSLAIRGFRDPVNLFSRASI